MRTLWSIVGAAALLFGLGFGFLQFTKTFATAEELRSTVVLIEKANDRSEDTVVLIEKVNTRIDFMVLYDRRRELLKDNPIEASRPQAVIDELLFIETQIELLKQK